MKTTIETLQNKAKERGGLCLSAQYLGATKKHLFKCHLGHEWEVNWNHLFHGTWCPTCAGKIKPTFNDWQKQASIKGGFCLSNEIDYKNKDSKLSWRCIDGHEWQASWHNIKKGQWCPSCVNPTESMVRSFLEFMLEVTLPAKSPEWLKNNKKKRYILDGFSDDKKISFEYHGEQHFKHNVFFHKDNKTLYDQINRDIFVRDKCLENNVKLIEIPFIPYPITVESIIEKCTPYIIDIVQKEMLDKKISEYKQLPFFTSKIKEIQKQIDQRNGVILSNQYSVASSFYKFKCEHGHCFNMTWNAVQQGRWCPKCSGKTSPTLEEIKDKAVKKGGLCLAKEGDYKLNTTKLLWECAKGHQWLAGWTNIQRGKWCSVCVNQVPPNLLQMQSKAIEKGGLCLAGIDEYKNSRTKLKWQCSKGHKWLAGWNNINTGTWCPQCAGKLPPLLKDMQAKAAEQGGLCLSKEGEYKNRNTKLLWECAK